MQISSSDFSVPPQLMGQFLASCQGAERETSGVISDLMQEFIAECRDAERALQRQQSPEVLISLEAMMAKYGVENPL